MAPRKPQKARDPESDEEPSFGADREESDGQSDSSNMQGLSPSLSPPIKRSSRTASSKVTSTISDSFSRFTRDGYGASILAKAKAETSKGYRPSKATHSAKLKETLVSGSGSGSGNSKVSQFGVHVCSLI
jgi:hypothetical protein